MAESSCFDLLLVNSAKRDLVKFFLWQDKAYEGIHRFVDYIVLVHSPCHIHGGRFDHPICRHDRHPDHHTRIWLDDLQYRGIGNGDRD